MSGPIKNKFENIILRYSEIDQPLDGADEEMNSDFIRTGHAEIILRDEWDESIKDDARKEMVIGCIDYCRMLFGEADEAGVDVVYEADYEGDLYGAAVQLKQIRDAQSEKFEEENFCGEGLYIDEFKLNQPWRELDLAVHVVGRFLDRFASNRFAVVAWTQDSNEFRLACEKLGFEKSEKNSDEERTLARVTRRTRKQPRVGICVGVRAGARTSTKTAVRSWTNSAKSSDESSQLGPCSNEKSTYDSYVKFHFD